MVGDRTGEFRRSNERY